jgi:integrase
MTNLTTLPPTTQLAYERLREYVSAADAPNTLKAYQRDLEHFRQWGGTIPASPTLVADYLVAHAEQLTIATLKRRLVGIGRAHATYGLPNPVPTELVRLTMRGIAKRHGKPQRKMKPLVKEDVLRLLVCMGTDLRGLRNQALLLIAFAGGFRRSEVVALRIEHLAFQREGVVITLPRSKTDQTGQGRKVGIPYGRGSVCPVKSLTAWLEAANITEGVVFRQVAKGNRLSGSLSPQAMVELVKEWGRDAGLEVRDLAAHSLRAGMVTSAAQAGVPTHKIMAQTGHRSVEVMSGYIRDANLFSQNAAGGLF